MFYSFDSSKKLTPEEMLAKFEEENSHLPDAAYAAAIRRMPLALKRGSSLESNASSTLTSPSVSPIVTNRKRLEGS